MSSLLLKIENETSNSITGITKIEFFDQNPNTNEKKLLKIIDCSPAITLAAQSSSEPCTVKGFNIYDYSGEKIYFFNCTITLSDTSTKSGSGGGPVSYMREHQPYSLPIY
ncbi:MAG: hypothetical protein LBD22_06895 [Spirochaetaceae bacterium]|jgi:hypothetical protein|nr:hypothetical protein [Spirochaetaceae bacterium]